MILTGSLSDTVLAICAVTLRLGPCLAFAPPFTLLRAPLTIRVLLAIGLSIWLISARPDIISAISNSEFLLQLMIGELLVGLSIALGLQIVFSGILWAGRAVDIQAGFGLAMLADPTTNAQIPLAGTILAYGAGIVFFMTGGHYELMALWAQSYEGLPVGFRDARPDIMAMAAFMSISYFIAIGLVGVAILAIFLADIVIAFLSRTLPQMNVLLLGFQVKAMIMLVTLPICLAFALPLYLRLLRLAITEAPTFWRVTS